MFIRKGWILLFLDDCTEQSTYVRSYSLSHWPYPIICYITVLYMFIVEDNWDRILQLTSAII